MNRLRSIQNWLMVVLKEIQIWNWRAIIIAFIASFTFWILNALNSEHTNSIVCPIDIHYAESDIVPLFLPPEEVSVNITGQGWNILKKSWEVQMRPISIYISDVNKSDLIKHINVKPRVLQELSKRLKGIKINYMMEDSLFCSFDTITHKDVYLSIDKKDILIKNNYKIISDITIDPNHIQISGPSSILPQYSDTFFLKIQKKDIATSFDEKVAIQYKKKKFVYLSSEEVSIKFDVIMLTQKILPLKLTLLNFPDGYTNFSIVPQKGKIIFYVNSRELLEPRDSVEALLDFNDLNSSDSSIIPELVLPIEFYKVTSYPEKFTIHFK